MIGVCHEAMIQVVGIEPRSSFLHRHAPPMPTAAVGALLSLTSAPAETIFAPALASRTVAVPSVTALGRLVRALISDGVIHPCIRHRACPQGTVRAAPVRIAAARAADVAVAATIKTIISSDVGGGVGTSYNDRQTDNYTRRQTYWPLQRF